MQGFVKEMPLLLRGAQHILWPALVHADRQGYDLGHALVSIPGEHRDICDGCVCEVYECYYMEQGVMDPDAPRILCWECVDDFGLKAKDMTVTWGGKKLLATRAAELPELLDALKSVDQVLVHKDVPLYKWPESETVDAGYGGRIWAISRRDYEEENNMFTKARIDWHHRMGVPYMVVGNSADVSLELWEPDTLFKALRAAAADPPNTASPVTAAQAMSLAGRLSRDLTGEEAPEELPICNPDTKLPGSLPVSISAHELLRAYKENTGGYVLANFPIHGTLEKRMPLYHQDALKSFRMSVENDLVPHGSFTLAPDMSAKIYLNAGPTRGFFHLDALGAVNSMKNGGGQMYGSTWTVAPRMPLPLLEHMLRSALDAVALERRLETLPKEWTVHDHNQFLEDVHLEYLFDKYSLRLWKFEQRLKEDVVIPMGCGHQVENSRSAVKVALDTLRPDEIEACMAVSADRREQARAQFRAARKRKRTFDPTGDYLQEKVQLHRLVCTSFLKLANT